MTFRRKILIVFLIVIGFDVVAALYSKSFRFDYVRFEWISYFIYMAAGFLGSYKQGLKFGVLLGFLTGLIDSTLGWFIVMQIHPYLSVEIPQITFSLIVIVVVAVTLQSTILSLVGVIVCKLLGKNKSVE